MTLIQYMGDMYGAWTIHSPPAKLAGAISRTQYLQMRMGWQTTVDMFRHPMMLLA